MKYYKELLDKLSKEEKEIKENIAKYLSDNQIIFIDEIEIDLTHLRAIFYLNITDLDYDRFKFVYDIKKEQIEPPQVYFKKNDLQTIINIIDKFIE